MTTGSHYAIGTAAKLIGITPHTLRKWEDRYDAVKPMRTEGGDRRYSVEDIERLAQLKELVDAGHPISSVATLTEEALGKLLNSRPRTRGDATESKVIVGVLGSQLAKELERNQTRMPGVTIAAIATH
ncbi:MAG: MerR family transcriptional regulator, partial [Pseudomonadota bacterium]